MPLIRRVPKRGFTNLFKVRYQVVNLARLSELEGEVTPQVLAEKGWVRSGHPVKILGNGEISTALKVQAHKFSGSARTKIEAAGGSCEVLEW